LVTTILVPSANRIGLDLFLIKLGKSFIYRRRAKNLIWILVESHALFYPILKLSDNCSLYASFPPFDNFLQRGTEDRKINSVLHHGKENYDDPPPAQSAIYDLLIMFDDTGSDPTLGNIN
jgi:hypothetical protein